MKKYRIAIEETLRKVVEIEAETPGLAVCRAEDEYNEEKHVLSADNFAGADIALSADDTTLMEALGNTDFMEYVQCRFEEYRESISIEDKIRLAFGSFDNALFEFGEYRKEAARNRPQVYLLYRSDAWHSRSSMELIAPFSSLENMMEYLRRKKKEFRLTESDLEEFENNRQTQGRDGNYLYESDYLDVLPEQEPNCRRKTTLSMTRFSLAGNPSCHAGSWNPCRSRSTPAMLRTNRWNRLCTKRKWRPATGCGSVKASPSILTTTAIVKSGGKKWKKHWLGTVYHTTKTNNGNRTCSSHAIMMTGRRGYGCGGLFFHNEVNIPPLIQNDYLLLKKRIYETDKTGFLHGKRGRNQNHDVRGVRPAYPAYGMRGKSGTVCHCEPADTGVFPAALCQKGTMERHALLPARRAQAGSPYHQFCGSPERGV